MAFSSMVLPALFWAGSVLPSVLPVFPVSLRQKLPSACTPAVLLPGQVTPPAVLLGGSGKDAEVKPNTWFWPRGSVCLMILISPQLLMFTGTGATKSLSSAVNDAEERLLRNALPNASQVPGGNTPAAVRLMAVSPKVSAGTLLVPGRVGSVTASRLFTAPIESVPLRTSLLPQHGRVLAEKHWLVGPEVTHRSSPRVGVPPPLVKSKVISRS